MTRGSSESHPRGDEPAPSDFASVLEALPDPVLVHRDGALLYANRALLDALGYADPAELQGGRLDSLVHATSADALRRGLHSGELTAVDFVHRQGHAVRLEGRCLPVRFQGAAAHVVLARDATAQRKLEERMMHTERMASVGTLAAGVAHEINNPLAAVMANLEYLMNEVREQASASPTGRLAEMEEVLRDAREAADRIRRIVRGMRVFSRADEDRQMVLELPRVLDSALEMMGHQIRHRGRLVKEYQKVPRVLSDETRLVQVFINLLTNAAQCLPEGRNDINEVRVRLLTDERGFAVVEVRDNGPGMTHDVQKRMFDPFFTTKPVGVGTGLGLAIAHGVVHGAGGYIECESAPEQGSVFRVALPPAPDEGADTEPPSSEARLSRARVLVIDDEPQVGKVLRRLLGKEHDVVVFESSTDALAFILSGEPFDIAFCDLMMPILSGQDLYRAVSEHVPARLEKMVFITGGAFAPETRRFLDEVPNQRLEKPFDGQQVRAMVRASLRSRTRAPHRQ